MKYMSLKIISGLMIAICLVILFSFRHNANQEQHPSKNNQIQLNVAAYNVEFSDKGTAEEIGAFLKPYNFDVVCFSEAPGGDWTAKVGAIMGLNHVIVGKYPTAGHLDKYKTIASRMPLSGYEEVLMADTLHTVTRATTIVNDKVMALYSVHFPFGWRDQAHIDETTAKVTAFVDYLKARQTKEVSILMGDFNFVLSTQDYRSPYYEMFVDLGMVASWRDLNIDVTRLGSMVKFEPGKNKAGGVIDHIIYPRDKVKAIDGQIIEMEAPLSDHKPVWALLEIK
ncbi:endonuclease/exonuclease/phosphatase family protein [Arenibacter sp. BSSL-BM3]|uniref:Endonuclease/exonuclease/phosphatase family protein n=1 Tax=Arenibacter arenosicollis TaxID=2762274 RepID=A0ABR7QMX7_9FLAO|nr:endonuclease/exonuclease/phosphatase family protein [Arenibacter arenosicollis]MBC8768548.1 endonuclease/exonuclease/phosphatase family protein [Arenibacter arenosicollis]